MGLTKKQLRMAERLIDEIMSDAAIDFIKCSREVIQGTGPLDARFFERAADRMAEVIESSVGLALKELSDNVHPGTRDWENLHRYLARSFASKTADLRKWANDVEGTDDLQIRLGKANTNATLSKASDRISRSANGWGAAKPKPWYESNLIAAKIIDWGIPAGCGGLATFLAQRFLG